MKKFILLKLTLFTLVFTFSAANLSAQTEDAQEADAEQSQPVRRRQLLRELGLSEEQIRRIRVLNAERKPLMQQAQRRLRVANRELDAAIYADAVDEAAIGLRLKEVQAAHAEVHKIRSMTELEVRKILTPAQLAKFRELRETFQNRIRNNRQRRQNRRQTRQADPLKNENQDPAAWRQNRRQKP